MDMTKVALVGVTIIVLSVSAWVHWANRDSPGIWERAVSWVIGGLAVSTISLLMSQKQEESSLLLPATVIIDESTGQPLIVEIGKKGLGKITDYEGLNAFFISQPFVAGIVQPSQDFTKDLRDAYEDVVFALALNKLGALYFGSWQIRAERTETGHSKGTRYLGMPTKDGKVVPWRTLLGTLSRRDAYETALKDHMPGENILFPPESKVEVSEGPKMRRLHVENRFVEFDITVGGCEIVRGLGQYGMLMGVDETKTNGYLGFTYDVRTSMRTKKWTSAHPAMPAHKRWCSLVSEELALELDGARRLQRLKDGYLLVTLAELRARSAGASGSEPATPSK